VAKSATHQKHLKLYTEQPPKPVRPPIEAVGCLPELLRAFQAATGWTLRYASGSESNRPAGPTWSVPVAADPTLASGFLRLEPSETKAEGEMRKAEGEAGSRQRAVGSELLESKIQNPKSKIYLSLGNVQVIAQVRLNGRDLGILWKPPYRVEISGPLRPGENTLEVKVTNLWVNRMIGDEQLPDDSDRKRDGTLKAWPDWLEAGKPSPTGRQTFTTWRLWKKNSPLLVSGLLGPVTVQEGRD